MSTKQYEVDYFLDEDVKFTIQVDALNEMDAIEEANTIITQRWYQVAEVR